MNTCVMGLTASGKTYQSRALAERLRLTYVSGSTLLLRKLGLAEDADRHFWLESSAQVNHLRDTSDADRETDNKLLELARTKNGQVFDSWTLPWLYDGQALLRIYLNPGLSERAAMAMNSRESRYWPLEDLMPRIADKDESSRQRFLQLYGCDIFSTAGFDLVYDNSKTTPEETLSILASVIMVRLGRTT